jgi:glycerophosphoryl diester phosphodiesterase
MKIRFFLLLFLLTSLLSSCAPYANRQARLTKLEIVAHRGANNLAPENTFAAARKCVALGVDYVELDVRTSADGVFYILHDKTLDRTTNGTGAIKEKDSAYIDTLDAGSWFSRKFKNEKVPRLAPYLNEFKDKIKIYFDVKDADLAKLVDLVYEAGFENDCFFWFSNDDRARELRQIDKTIGLKMNAQSFEELQHVMQYNPQIIETRLQIFPPEFVSYCRAYNLKIMAHALEKRADRRYRDIINSPADMVNLDRADIMSRLIK